MLLGRMTALRLPEPLGSEVEARYKASIRYAINMTGILIAIPCISLLLVLLYAPHILPH